MDFVDIDPNTLNMSPAALEVKLKAAKVSGSLPKIVVPVHFSGEPCDMRKIRELSKEYGFKIIEDASHAVGGSYQGGKVGNCQYSDITVFSFHPVKIITTAEGAPPSPTARSLRPNLPCCAATASLAILKK